MINENFTTEREDINSFLEVITATKDFKNFDKFVNKYTPK